MRLMGFRYLSRRRLLFLFLTLMLASMLFSVTALSFLGYYSSFNSYLGEEEDIIVIYDKGSRTPFSGLVPTYLAEHMKSLNGVLASSPEIVIPSIVKDQPVFVRGITEEFAKINAYSLQEGEKLSINDVNQAIVGKELSERLNIKVGDKILVHSVLVEQYLALQVKGIFKSKSTIDDEILIPLCCGQWLRGTDYDHTTLIRVKIDKSKVDHIAIFKEIAEEASEPTSNENGGEATSNMISSRKVSFALDKIGLEETRKFMKGYLDRYGMTKENLIILSVTVLIFASATIIITSKTIIQQHEHEIGVLKSIGASDGTIKKDLLVKLLPWSSTASTLGIIMATLILQIFGQNGQLQAFSHRILIQPDILIIALNFVLIATLTVMAIIRSNAKATQNN
jgi:ABC-type lipoprotein release transport system permease subunit